MRTPENQTSFQSVKQLFPTSILVLAYLATYNATEGSFQGSTWYRLKPGHELTLVGYWYALVSLPIFQFLIFAGYTV
jgi:hypothetical protein